MVVVVLVVVVVVLSIEELRDLVCMAGTSPLRMALDEMVDTFSRPFLAALLRYMLD